MAKAKQEKDERRTPIVVAMIGAAAVIVAGVLGLIGSLSNKSDGQSPVETASPTATAADYAPTTVYVTSVSTTGISARSVTWKFTGTVKPPPGGRGAVFILGKTIDGSKSVNSDPVSIASDGAWVAVVGPIPRDFAREMKWIAAYGEMLVNDADRSPNAQAPRRSAPSETRHQIEPDSGSGGSIEPEAVTEIPKKMLPPLSP